MSPISMKAPDGASSFVHDRVTYPVEHGYIEVPHSGVADEAKSHGFIDEANPPKVVATTSIDGVTIPREVFMAGLKALGVAGTIPDDKLLEAFTEVCNRQEERVQFLIRAEGQASDRRHAERLDIEVAAAELRGEERALKALAEKTPPEGAPDPAKTEPPAKTE